MGGACSANGEKGIVYIFLVGKPNGKKNYLGDPDVDGRIIRWIFRKWDAGVWNRSSWLRIWTDGGHL
jgi:hypothetical protein